MKSLSQAEKIYLTQVAIYKNLKDFGYCEKVANKYKNRIKEVRFESENFVFIFGFDELKDEYYTSFLDAVTEVELPSPMWAIFYFSFNIEKIISAYKPSQTLEENLAVTFQIYRENFEVLRNKNWTLNKSFLEAVTLTTEWAESLKKPLEKWEFERHIHALK